MRTNPLQNWLLLNVESLNKCLVSTSIISIKSTFSFFPLPFVLFFSFSTSTSSHFRPLHPPCASLSPPGWQRAVIWRRLADDWQLYVLWLLMNSVKQSAAARLCNCNEGQKERRQGSGLFSFLVTHSWGNTSCWLFFFLSAPSPIIAVFCYPNHTLPGEAARLKETKQILHLHVTHTLVYFLVFA